jgi:hypothetical protein
MSDQLILAWTVDVTNSSFGPVQAAAALAAVTLYENPTTDPVLGQFFGLTVFSYSTAPGPSSATRTLTLNMTPAAAAPPPFPCHPRTSTPPELPYPLRTTKTLPGSFFVENGVATVDTTDSQIPSLSNGDVLQFLSQQGVFYTVAAPPGSTSIVITPAYSGTTGNTGAFKEVAAPVTLAAFYSTSELDTDAVATVPPIPQGPGAQTVQLDYKDSTGSPFTSTVTLTGKRPAAVVLAGGSVDIAEIVGIAVGNVGGFASNIGEITLVELSEALADLPPDLPLGTGIGASETTTGKAGFVPRTFKTMTDDAQMLIDRHLAYLPPSFAALSDQQASYPPLLGDFLVTTGSLQVQTTEDQTSVLSAGDFIEFAVQPGTIYTIADLTDAWIKLTTVFLGIDTNNTGLNNTPMNNEAQTKGNVGDALLRKPTGARSPSVTVVPPSDDAFSAPLGQYVETQVAAPPPKPPLSPATVPTPTFLSDYFTQTIQLALAGVPITAQPISFA